MSHHPYAPYWSHDMLIGLELDDVLIGAIPIPITEPPEPWRQCPRLPALSDEERRRAVVDVLGASPERVDYANNVKPGHTTLVAREKMRRVRREPHLEPPTVTPKSIVCSNCGQVAGLPCRVDGWADQFCEARIGEAGLLTALGRAA